MSRKVGEILSSPETSYVALMGTKIPKYIIKIEIFEAKDTPTDVVIKGCSKAQYVVYDLPDGVLYKAKQLIFEMSAELGTRNERIF